MNFLVNWENWLSCFDMKNNWRRPYSTTFSNYSTFTSPKKQLWHETLYLQLHGAWVQTCVCIKLVCVGTHIVIFHDSDTVTGKFPWPLQTCQTDKCCRSPIVHTHSDTHTHTHWLYGDRKVADICGASGEDMAFSPHFSWPITQTERGKEDKAFCLAWQCPTDTAMGDHSVCEAVCVCVCVHACMLGLSHPF